MGQSYLEVKDPHTWIPVPGTWAWDENPNKLEWYEVGSNIDRKLSSLNLKMHAVGALMWPTNLDGTPMERNHTIWKGAGKHLVCHCQRVPLEQRNIIAHSHGGNVVFYGCSYGLKINNLITVGTPVRRDMEKVVLAARPNIGFWLHISDASFDLMAYLGTMFDRRFRIKQLHNFDLADKNDDVSDIGHSKVLNDALGGWDERGWASMLAYGGKAIVQ